jgi:DNA gyrase inhibitor GyrI
MPSFEVTSSCRTAYLRRHGPYGSDNAAQIAEVKRWAEQAGLLTEDAILFGVAHDDPTTTPPSLCRYDAGLVVVTDVVLSGSELREGTLPGGRCAVFETAHTAEGLLHAWRSAFPALAESGQSIDHSRPIYERYVPRLLAMHRCELVVPIHSAGLVRISV